MICSADPSLARRLLGLTLLLLGAQWAHAGDTAGGEVKHLLERMMESLRTLEYSGTFVYLHGSQLETLEITHAVRGGQELERLVSLNGSAREVRRDQRAVTCVMPDSRAVSVDPRAPGAGLWPTLGPDLGRLASMYLLYPLGESRIAGRNTQVVGIIPKDKLRYGYRFYLDRATALPLKTDLMDEHARPLEQIMFTSLSLQPVDIGGAGDATPDGFRRLLRQAPHSDPHGHGHHWTFDGLPAGFELHLRHLWSDEDDHSVEHLVLSDGLASGSVYVEPSGTEGLRGAANVGAVNAWGGVVDGYQVTAVGEVPKATVQVVVDALHQREEEVP
jgi:sigma-E factor negative regulatory protein RseB